MATGSAHLQNLVPSTIMLARQGTAERLARREIAVLLVLIGIAAGLRGYRFSDLGLIHFDEGPYCTSALWVLQPPGQRELYPDQQILSPPVHFTLVGLAYLLSGGARDMAAIAVSVVFGVATVPLVWWSARRLSGAGAGLAAATFLTFSNYHIAYSRMALTDVLFAFFFLVSIHAMVVAVERASLGWSILAGLLVGLAWNTKYHGWLSLCVTWAALVPAWMLHRRGVHKPGRRILCLLTVTVLAGLCYLPWALYVEYEGVGYLTLLRHHRSFLSHDWLGHPSAQAACQWYFDGWCSRLSPVLAVLACAVGSGVNRGIETVLPGALLVGLVSGLALGGAGAAALAALAAVLILIRSRSYRAWVMVVFLASLFLATLLYHPFPRLAMPLVLGCYIVAGVFGEVAMGGSARHFRVKPVASRWARRLVWPVALAVALAAVLVFKDVRLPPRTWMATGGLRAVAAEISAMVPPNARIVVGEGPLMFYLRVAGHDVVHVGFGDGLPVQTIDRARAGGRPTFFLTGIYMREPWGRKAFAQLRGRLAEVARYRFTPNDVRLLDNFSGADARAFRRNPTDLYDLILYNVVR